MSSVVFSLKNFFHNANEILAINKLIKIINDCGNDELIIETSDFQYVDLETIKYLICLTHITDKNKTVKFVDTVRFEDLKWNKNND